VQARHGRHERGRSLLSDTNKTTDKPAGSMAPLARRLGCAGVMRWAAVHVLPSGSALAWDGALLHGARYTVYGATLHGD
jgi:hypothetical protein